MAKAFTEEEKIKIKEDIMERSEDITLDLFSYEELCQKMKNICG